MFDALRRVPLIAVGTAIGGTALLSLIGAAIAPPDSAQTSPVPTLSGETAQREPFSAVVQYGRLTSFDVSLRQLCEGPDGAITRRVRWTATVPVLDGVGNPTQLHGDTKWQYTWRPALGPDGTIRDLGAVPPISDARDATSGLGRDEHRRRQGHRRSADRHLEHLDRGRRLLLPVVHAALAAAPAGGARLKHAQLTATRRHASADAAGARGRPGAHPRRRAR